MMPLFTLVRTINFKEMPSLKATKEPKNFDNQSDKAEEIEGDEKPIISVCKDDQKKYCKYLLLNIKKMEIEDTEGYINKLLVQTVWPIAWLNSLEKLVNLNLLLLEGKANPLFLSTFHIFIDKRRKELEATLVHEDGMNIRRPNGTYSFKKVKFHLSKIDDFAKKKLFLTKCKIEYQQFKPRYITNGQTPFDEKIDLEIQRVTSEHKFHRGKREEENRSPIPNIQKIKINSQINQFVDIFFRMINECKIENKPLIETSNANVARLLSYFFKDSTDALIEQSTIETYLQRNKPETRPKEYNRIRF